MRVAWLVLVLQLLFLIRQVGRTAVNADACTLMEEQWLGELMPCPKSQWVDVSGIRTHHLFLHREASPMVLLHGTGSAAALAWSSTAGKLASRYAIYAPDLPAFGRTLLAWDTFQTATHAELEDVYADWLAHYIEALALVKPIVVAHSIGAFFAVKFAKKYPAKLAKLILVDPAGLLPTLGRFGCYFAWLFRLGIPTKPIRGAGKVGAALLSTLFDVQKSSRAYYWLQVNASPTAFGDHVVGKFITTRGLSGYWNRPALWDLLTAGVPVAFIYGETDSLVPPSQGRVVEEVGMRDGLVGLVPGAHTPFHVQNGEPFVEAVWRAVDAASVLDPTPTLVQTLALLDPSLFASSWNPYATARTIDRFYAYLRKVN